MEQGTARGACQAGFGEPSVGSPVKPKPGPATQRRATTDASVRAIMDEHSMEGDEAAISTRRAAAPKASNRSVRCTATHTAPCSLRVLASLESNGRAARWSGDRASRIAAGPVCWSSAADRGSSSRVERRLTGGRPLSGHRSSPGDPASGPLDGPGLSTRRGGFTPRPERAASILPRRRKRRDGVRKQNRGAISALARGVRVVESTGSAAANPRRFGSSGPKPFAVHPGIVGCRRTFRDPDVADGPGRLLCAVRPALPAPHVDAHTSGALMVDVDGPLVADRAGPRRRRIAPSGPEPSIFSRNLSRRRSSERSQSGSRFDSDRVPSNRDDPERPRWRDHDVPADDLRRSSPGRCPEPGSGWRRPEPHPVPKRQDAADGSVPRSRRIRSGLPENCVSDRRDADRRSEPLLAGTDARRLLRQHHDRARELRSALRPTLGRHRPHHPGRLPRHLHHDQYGVGYRGDAPVPALNGDRPLVDSAAVLGDRRCSRRPVRSGPR